MMLAKFKRTPGWYECNVVCETTGDRWVVEEGDDDKEDTLKESHHLKKRMSVWSNGRWDGRREIKRKRHWFPKPQ